MTDACSIAGNGETYFPEINNRQIIFNPQKKKKKKNPRVLPVPLVVARPLLRCSCSALLLPSP
jgi:hypothetical protein